VSYNIPANTDQNQFTDPDESREQLRKRVSKHPELEYQPLGLSEEGRPLYAVEFGEGPLRVSLLAGAHSDEPVGPETLRLFINTLMAESGQKSIKKLKETFTFHIIPHINPDGEAVNWQWIRKWPDMDSYLQHAFREQPGRDLEFGYPNMRVENRLVSSYLRSQGTFDLHMSLHGMAFSEGLMLLIERHWIDQTESLRNHFKALADQNGLPLHDHDRGGEKGFKYIAPGFSTTPEGRAMRQHFENKGDTETAQKFHLSSMEYVRSLGGSPLCLVTELPLFLVAFKEEPEKTEPDQPEAYLSLKEKIPLLRKRRSQGESFDDLLAPYKFTSLPLSTALSIQFRTIEAALELIEEA